MLTIVSIHASVKDATEINKLLSSLTSSFNPRICKRCDPDLPGIAKAGKSFNPRICKRCDSCWSLNTAASRCFNPRICKRCDK